VELKKNPTMHEDWEFLGKDIVQMVTAVKNMMLIVEDEDIEV